MGFSCAARPSAERLDLYLRAALADCVSGFHQLIYIARFWNSETALYVDSDSGEILPDILSVAVKRLHDVIFQSWLARPLDEQHADFQAYLDTLSYNDRDALLRRLSLPAAREGLAPPTASEQTKQLMSSDLQLIVVVAAVRGDPAH